MTAGGRPAGGSAAAPLAGSPRVIRNPWTSQPPRDAKRTGTMRAPSGEVTASPGRGFAGTPARAASVARQNGKKPSGLASGGRVARTAPSQPLMDAGRGAQPEPAVRTVSSQPLADVAGRVARRAPAVRTASS